MAQLGKYWPAMRETLVRSLGWEGPWRRAWQPLQYSCLENPRRQRSLVGYSPWGRKESDVTGWLSAHLYEGHDEASLVSLSAWSRPVYCYSVQVLLCMAFGSRLHNSKWGNYLALIVKSFDYHRSDVAVWLNYLIFLVWHVGVIRLTG